MTYIVQHAQPERDSSGNYLYKIFRNDKLIANYWHDFRGDDHGLEFTNGIKKNSPLGSMINFLSGGGPKPLSLSAGAIAFLDEHE